MSISENKRVLALSVAFLAAFGGVAYLGYSRSCDYEKAQAELTEIQEAFDGYSSADFAPTSENLKALREAFDGEKLTSMQDLQAQLQYYAAGETVDMTVYTKTDSGYEEKTVSVTLGDRSELSSN